MKSKEQYVKVFEKTYYRSEIEKMTVDEITELINSIPIAISVCNDTLKKEKDLAKVKNALHAKTQLQISMGWISAIRKKKRRLLNNDFNESFRKAAKEILPNKTFTKIETKAKILNLKGEPK